jgi:hypothetical protein
MDFQGDHDAGDAQPVAVGEGAAERTHQAEI